MRRRRGDRFGLPQASSPRSLDFDGARLRRELPAALGVLGPRELRMVQKNQPDHETVREHQRQQGKAHAKTIGDQEIGLGCFTGSGFDAGHDAIDAQAVPRCDGGLAQGDRHLQGGSQGLPDPVLRGEGLHIKVGAEQKHTPQDQCNDECADRVPAKFPHVERT